MIEHPLWDYYKEDNMRQSIAALHLDFRQAWRSDKRISYGLHLLWLFLTGSILWFFVLTVALLFFSGSGIPISLSFGKVALGYFIGFLFYGWWWHVLVYQLVARHGRHVERKKLLFRDLYYYAYEFLLEKGYSKEDHPDLVKKVYSLQFFSDEYGKSFHSRHAGLWTILSVVTLGIAAYVAAFFLMEDVKRMQKFEKEYLEHLSEVFMDLDVLSYPIPYDREVPMREFGIFLALSFVTLGLFWFYWWYVLVADYNIFFDASERWEGVCQYTLLYK